MKTSLRPMPSTPRDFQFPAFERSTLANGMRMVVAPMHRLPVVTAILVIDGGAASELSGKEGLADIVAHCLVEGTVNRSADDLVMALERLGTSVSASADWESSILKMTVMSANLRSAFALMAEIAIAPRFDEAAVARIRDERLSEIIQTRSEPRVLADERFSADLYGPDSRYGIPVGGSAKSVTGITAQDVRAYHSAEYNPGAATLILAGDVKTSEAERLAAELFGQWNSGGTNRPARQPAHQPATPTRLERQVRVVDRSGAQQSELRVGHVGVSRAIPEYFEAVVMNAVLGGLFSSRINLNLREVHGYTYGASSYFDWRREAGPFVVSTAVQSEVTGAAIAEVLKEIGRIQNERIQSDELSLATSYLAGVFPIRYETADAVASGLASLVIFNLPDDYFTSYRSRILGVTVRGVQEAAQKFLNLTAMTVVVAGNPELVSPQLASLQMGEVSVVAADA
ncbi:MAG: insulinase family protein [Gemmatimonadaceae bacterium]|nr:insulinase family protein [Gemmatimonadaceae bacterium]